MVSNLHIVKSMSRQFLFYSVTAVLLFCFSSSVQAQFAFNFGGTGFDQTNLVKADDFGNIFISGQYSGGADFDPGPGTSILEGEDLTRIFLASYSATGDLRFAFAFGGGDGSGISVTSMAVDGAGNVYITGLFQGLVDFAPGPEEAVLGAVIHQEYFFASYDNNGAYRFAHDLSFISVFQLPFVEVDEEDNVYLAGNSIGPTDLDFGPEEALIEGNDLTTFLSSYDSEGNFRFVIPLLLSGNVGRIDVDSNERVIISGNFQFSPDFDPGPGVAQVDKAGANFFVAAYSKNGEFLQVYGFSRGNADVTDIEVDAEGNSYISGFIQSEIDFSTGDEEFLIEGTFDGFLVSYDSEGVPRFGFSYDDLQKTLEERLATLSIITDIIVGPEGDLFVVGAFAGNVDFDPGAGVSDLVTQATADFFLVQYGSDGSFLAVEPFVVDNRGQCNCWSGG